MNTARLIIGHGSHLVKNALAKIAAKRTIGGVMALIGIASFPSLAMARTIGSWSGKPVSLVAGKAPNYSCFAEFFGGVTGVSPAIPACVNAAWEVNLPIESPPAAGTSYSLHFGGQNVCCTAYGINEANGNVHQTPEKCASNFKIVALDPVLVPFTGSLMLSCHGFNDFGSQVTNVQY